MASALVSCAFCYGAMTDDNLRACLGGLLLYLPATVSKELELEEPRRT
jgi:hypothetical protein